MIQKAFWASEAKTDLIVRSKNWTSDHLESHGQCHWLIWAYFCSFSKFKFGLWISDLGCNSEGEADQKERNRVTENWMGTANPKRIEWRVQWYFLILMVSLHLNKHSQLEAWERKERARNSGWERVNEIERVHDMWTEMVYRG